MGFQKGESMPSVSNSVYNRNDFKKYSVSGDGVGDYDYERAKQFLVDYSSNSDSFEKPLSRNNMSIVRGDNIGGYRLQGYGSEISEGEEISSRFDEGRLSDMLDDITTGNIRNVKGIYSDKNGRIFTDDFLRSVWENDYKHRADKDFYATNNADFVIDADTFEGFSDDSFNLDVLNYSNRNKSVIDDIVAKKKSSGGSWADYALSPNGARDFFTAISFGPKNFSVAGSIGYAATDLYDNLTQERVSAFAVGKDLAVDGAMIGLNFLGKGKVKTYKNVISRGIDKAVRSIGNKASVVLPVASVGKGVYDAASMINDEEFVRRVKRFEPNAVMDIVRTLALTSHTAVKGVTPLIKSRSNGKFVKRSETLSKNANEINKLQDVIFDDEAINKIANQLSGSDRAEYLSMARNYKRSFNKANKGVDKTNIDYLNRRYSNGKITRKGFDLTKNVKNEKNLPVLADKRVKELINPGQKPLTNTFVKQSSSGYFVPASINSGAKSNGQQQFIDSYFNVDKDYIGTGKDFSADEYDKNFVNSNLKNPNARKVYTKRGDDIYVGVIGGKGKLIVTKDNSLSEEELNKRGFSYKSVSKINSMKKIKAHVGGGPVNPYDVEPIEGVKNNTWGDLLAYSAPYLIDKISGKKDFSDAFKTFSAERVPLRYDSLYVPQQVGFSNDFKSRLKTKYDQGVQQTVTADLGLNNISNKLAEAKKNNYIGNVNLEDEKAYIKSGENMLAVKNVNIKGQSDIDNKNRMAEEKFNVTEAANLAKLNSDKRQFEYTNYVSDRAENRDYVKNIRDFVYRNNNNPYVNQRNDTITGYNENMKAKSDAFNSLTPTQQQAYSNAYRAYGLAKTRDEQESQLIIMNALIKN